VSASGGPRRRPGVGLLAAVAAAAALVAAGPAADAAAWPATPLPLLDGGTLDLRSLQGQVVVIRFLASW
jgi:hypothetical protein